MDYYLPQRDLERLSGETSKRSNARNRGWSGATPSDMRPGPWVEPRRGSTMPRCSTPPGSGDGDGRGVRGCRSAPPAVKRSGTVPPSSSWAARCQRRRRTVRTGADFCALGAFVFTVVSFLEAEDCFSAFSLLVVAASRRARAEQQGEEEARERVPLDCLLLHNN